VVFKKPDGGGAVGGEVFSYGRFHGYSTAVSNGGEVLKEDIDSGNVGVRFWEAASVGIGELDRADQVSGFAHDIAAFAFHREMIEVGGEADFGAIDFAGDGEGFTEGIQKIRFGVVDVLTAMRRPKSFS
jgi:hypothetical protein